MRFGMLIMLILMLIALGGCTTVVEEAGARVANAIDRFYCHEDESVRRVWRASVNAGLEDKGHSAIIRCDGDEQTDNTATEGTNDGQ